MLRNAAKWCGWQRPWCRSCGGWSSLDLVVVAEMRAQSQDEPFMADASEDSIAAVRADIPLPVCKELHRHCLARGVWAKLLIPWKAWLREHGAPAVRSADCPLGMAGISENMRVKV